MKNNDFVHLHLHTVYSLLKSSCRIEDIISKAVEFNQKSVAITDISSMYGVIKFYKEAKKHGIKPIIGCEIQLSQFSYIVLLCKNNIGYRNLIQIVSKISVNENKTYANFDILRKFSEGIICLSGNISEDEIANSAYSAAENKILKLKEIFDNDFYLEFQNHNLKSENFLNDVKKQICQKYNINPVATNNVYYINQEDFKIREALNCISLGKTFDERKIYNSCNEYYIKSSEEMSEALGSIPNAIENTVKIAESCNVEFQTGKIILPEYKIDGVYDNRQYFINLCKKGCIERYGNPMPEVVKERLKHELSVIIKMGYTDYYLIVRDFVMYAKNSGIPVGPGRGSGAGSLCAYACKITEIDPIKYSLLFERFLNPERVSMPDFDIDFGIIGRNKVKEYVISKYGSDRVCDVVTFDTLKSRSAIRDVSRIFAVDNYIVNEILQSLDPEIQSIKENLQKNPKLQIKYNSSSIIKKIIDYSSNIEDIPRNTSIHASAVVIAADPVTNLVPLMYGEDGVFMSQYPMEDIDYLGLLKFDFLGLRNLTIIDNCVKDIKKSHPEFDENNLPESLEVYNMLSKGDCEGVFQLESGGMINLLKKMKPCKLEDIIAAISLFRPGPMKSIPKYLENRKDPGNIKYDIPQLKPILDETYGVIIYQEQVMMICREIAGYSFGRADIVRRAMAKKKKSEMEKERKIFVFGEEGSQTCTGAIAHGVPKEKAEKLFDTISGFASYAFNKSHAASYAYLAYKTAYLKYFYFEEYFSALMNSCIGNQEKLHEYLKYCMRRSYSIEKPDINRSDSYFKKDVNKIKFGLYAIKGIGINEAGAIETERKKGGYFLSFEDFVFRMSDYRLSRNTIISLIHSGAMDNFNSNRRQMESSIDTILKSAYDKINELSGQMDLFGNINGMAKAKFEYPNLEEYSKNDLFRMEEDATGICFPNDTTEKYEWMKKIIHTEYLDDISNDISKKSLEYKTHYVFARIVGVKNILTRNGEKMAMVDFDDSKSEKRLPVFSNLYKRVSSKLNLWNYLCLTVRIKQKNGRSELEISNIIACEDLERFLQNGVLYIKLNSNEALKIKQIIEINKKYKGNCKLKFVLSDINKIFIPRNYNYVRICKNYFDEISKIVNKENIKFS